MSPLFGNKQEKAEQEAAASAEFERLTTLPARELAATILPAWGPDGVHRSKGGGVGSVQVANWLLAPNPRRGKYLQRLLAPVDAATQALEQAGLLVRTNLSIGGSQVDLSSQGQTALAEGSVERYLNGPATA